MKQLTRVFLFQSNPQADQSRCPAWPDGFPVRMLTYDKWDEERGMHPRDVDRLYSDELFWLPVVRAAKLEAAEALRPKD